ncbi:glycoside hydrolase family 13 protein [Mucilaginibacter sp. RB4R14]|uniref:glycoside hydrolase family 13 protein n=1 Tax=Mucilaginibacter aurantiaciroseus TaxID=2949308 RepID=UPI002091206D|nr:glycoside hydrolase family 13 protein [Mucilaginibacter aurantiaciroseus]MCO5936651.1 glycoside hydrolase family 13 protein [Mucilaginibacter aurantiaciroseus]
MRLRLHLTLGFLLLSGCLLAQVPALERIEPSFWWVGFHNPKVQLIVHGDKIAGSIVSLKYPGVKLSAVHKVENSNYLFLDLTIAAETRPGKFPITFKQAGKKDLIYTYELKQRNKSAEWAQGVTSKDLIYLLMPDRFANGDPSNDVVPGMLETGLHRDSMYSRHGGDIQGLINHLGYLKDLGVTAIWMTPEIENDEPRASYHGYAVTDYYKIDRRYGTNDLFKTYVAKSHKMGLKVIKDLVHNHIGTESWLIQDMPMKSWVHQWPNYTNSNFRDAAVMDPHGAAADKKQMLDGWFDRRMADVNQNNPYVQNYLTQNHIWWIEYAGIDGLRLDTYPYNDAAYMADWAKKLKAEFPHLSIFGETLVWSVANQAYFTQGNTVNRGFDTQLPGITDAQIKEAITEALNGKEGWTDGVYRLYNIVAQDFMYQDVTRNTIFLDNHDMSRFFSVVNEDITKFKSGMALLLTMRGVPQIYYGDEILMKGYSNPDGLVREDFSGGFEGDKKDKFTAEGRDSSENDAFNYVRTLANYRKNTTALQTGKLMQYIPRSGIYTYFRYDTKNTVMVAYNGNDKEAVLNTGFFNERMAGFNSGTNVITKLKIGSLNQLTIPAKTTLIIELSK